MYNSFKPGQVWLDTNGKPIQAHGFSVFYKDGTWYWYGENKEKTDGTPYEELLKDADVLQHILYNASNQVEEKYAVRYAKLKEELGLI